MPCKEPPPVLLGSFNSVHTRHCSSCGRLIVPPHTPISCLLMPLPSRLGSKATSSMLLSQIITPRLSEALMEVYLLYKA